MNFSKIKKNLKRGAAVALSSVILVNVAMNGNVAHAEEVSIDGEKPYCNLTIGANAAEGTGFALATLSFSKSGATKTVDASLYYKSGEKKYFTKGTTSVGGTSTYVSMQTRKKASVNAGARSINKIKYKEVKWNKKLEKGNPPASDKGWQQVG